MRAIKSTFILTTLAVFSLMTATAHAYTTISPSKLWKNSTLKTQRGDSVFRAYKNVKNTYFLIIDRYESDCKNLRMSILSGKAPDFSIKQDNLAIKMSIDDNQAVDAKGNLIFKADSRSGLTAIHSIEAYDTFTDDLYSGSILNLNLTLNDGSSLDYAFPLEGLENALEESRTQCFESNPTKRVY